MLKGVIFDMDGLMFDTERLSSKMWHKILTKYSLPINEKFIISIRGLNFKSSKELFYKYYQTDLEFKKIKDEKIKWCLIILSPMVSRLRKDFMNF